MTCVFLCRGSRRTGKRGSHHVIAAAVPEVSLPQTDRVAITESWRLVDIVVDFRKGDNTCQSSLLPWREEIKRRGRIGSPSPSLSLKGKVVGVAPSSRLVVRAVPDPDSPFFAAEWRTEWPVFLN